jgi:hypothetical protein
VTAYLEFAELQAMNRKPMYMADWISKLDDFLKLSDRQILNHAGAGREQPVRAMYRAAATARAVPSRITCCCPTDCIPS